MTGEKNRFTTTEKLWNLDDKQLSTPKHDELVLSVTPEFILSTFPAIRSALSNPENWLWTYDKEKVSEETARGRALDTLRSRSLDFSIVSINGDKSLKFHYSYTEGFKPSRTVPYHHITKKGVRGSATWLETQTEEEFRRLLRDNYEGEVGDTELKLAIAQHQSRVAEWEVGEAKKRSKREGDIALLEAMTIHELKISEESARYYKEFCEKIVPKIDVLTLISILHETPIILAYNKFIVGYWDIVVRLNHRVVETTFSDGWKYKTALVGEEIIPEIRIEAKPTINSYGEVIRQIKTYCSYLPRGGIVICLLTGRDIEPRIKTAFESQGITVITP